MLSSRVTSHQCIWKVIVIAGIQDGLERQDDLIGYCSYLGRKAICRQPQSCSQLPSRDPPLPVSPGWQPDYSIIGFLPAACIASSFPCRVGALQFLLPLFAAHFTASCSLLLKSFLNCMYSRECEKIWICTHINGGPGWRREIVYSTPKSFQVF